MTQVCWSPSADLPAPRPRQAGIEVSGPPEADKPVGTRAVLRFGGPLYFRGEATAQTVDDGTARGVLGEGQPRLRQRPPERAETIDKCPGQCSNPVEQMSGKPEHKARKKRKKYTMVFSPDVECPCGTRMVAVFDENANYVDSGCPLRNCANDNALRSETWEHEYVCLDPEKDSVERLEQMVGLEKLREHGLF